MSAIDSHSPPRHWPLYGRQGLLGEGVVSVVSGWVPDPSGLWFAACDEVLAGSRFLVPRKTIRSTNYDGPAAAPGGTCIGWAHLAGIRETCKMGTLWAVARLGASFSVRRPPDPFVQSLERDDDSW